jgi:hypothetical protein
MTFNGVYRRTLPVGIQSGCLNTQVEPLQGEFGALTVTGLPPVAGSLGQGTPTTPFLRGVYNIGDVSSQTGHCQL